MHSDQHACRLSLRSTTTLMRFSVWQQTKSTVSHFRLSQIRYGYFLFCCSERSAQQHVLLAQLINSALMSTTCHMHVVAGHRMYDQKVGCSQSLMTRLHSPAGVSVSARCTTWICIHVFCTCRQILTWLPAVDCTGRHMLAVSVFNTYLTSTMLQSISVGISCKVANSSCVDQLFCIGSTCSLQVCS